MRTVRSQYNRAYANTIAIYFGNTRIVDLLAEHGIVPRALWTYAACGRLDLVQACFDADGRLRPGAGGRRNAVVCVT